MARSLRVSNAGIYHVVNRGVGLREVYLCTEDKLFFIQLFCMYAEEYSYIIHAYTLVNNGYNLVIETKEDNLSKIMKIINARYTYYFNKKYGRRGYLWEGRFKSWQITKEKTLLSIVAYIEHLSVYTGVCKTKDNAYYASYRQFVGLDKRLPCLEKSIIFQKFHHKKQIEAFFSKKIDINYINDLHEQLKKTNKIVKIKKTVDLPKIENLKFSHLSRSDRNKMAYNLYQDGYTQKAIGDAIGISQQAVHSIITKFLK